MSTPFIGEVRIFAGNFAPVGWSLCNGQILAISQYDALFALIGTTYGGDGVTTFALPDLQCRVPLHFGTGPGLSSRVLGENSGTEQVTLNTSQMPAHTHPPLGLGVPGSSPSPSGNVWAGTSAGALYTAGDPAPATSMNANAILPVGGSQPHDNIEPFQCVNFIIALEGIFPTQG
jgi:microcystin-dependent protein